MPGDAFANSEIYSTFAAAQANSRRTVTFPFCIRSSICVKVYVQSGDFAIVIEAYFIFSVVIMSLSN